VTLRASRRTEFIRRARATLARLKQSDRRPAGPSSKEFFIHTPFRVGKYLVSPLSRPTLGGAFAASVSIRSGAGTMTHDRVLRFVPVFDTHEQAGRFASEQALAWLGPSGSCRSTTPQE
jgi:hypothetical protein